MRVAIVQSNYVPWKGYFDLISYVDLFVLYDEVQYTKRDWRNRNLIKTSSGLQWLSIPVRVKGKFSQSIENTYIVDKEWPKLHWKKIRQNYSKTPYFKDIQSWLEPLYNSELSASLSEVNYVFIVGICDYLGIETKIVYSSEYNRTKTVTGKSSRLVEICSKLKAKEYVSGLSAQNYLNKEEFIRENIKVHWFTYEGYPTYSQLWGAFEHKVSILDLLFNCGKDAKRYMKYV